MFKQAFQHYNEIYLTIVGMILFMSTYIALSIRAYVGKDTKESNRIANLPLQNEENAP